VASREVGCSAECYEHRSSRRIGLPTPTSNVLFPTVRWFSLGAVPRSLASSGSSSRELCLPYRVHPALSPVRPQYRSTCAEHLPGSLSHSRHEQLESTSRRASHGSPSFRPQRFSHSRRFPPPTTAWACFIPQPRPGFALQGVSLLPSRLTSSMSRALMSLVEVSYQ